MFIQKIREIIKKYEFESRYLWALKIRVDWIERSLSSIAQWPSLLFTNFVKEIPSCLNKTNAKFQINKLFNGSDNQFRIFYLFNLISKLPLNLSLTVSQTPIFHESIMCHNITCKIKPVKFQDRNWFFFRQNMGV